MDRLKKFYFNRQTPISNTYNTAKLTLFFIFLAVVGCKKDDYLNTRVLEIGTKVNIVSGVFEWGDKQPAAPLTVVSMYRSAKSGLIFYNVSDSNGVIWQIPDNDLQILK